MLIPLVQLVQKYNCHIKGVVHVGAHECEEETVYLAVGVSPERTIWVEGNPELVHMAKQRGKNIYEGLVSDQDGKDVEFMITNNGQSSSLLNLKEHITEHPHVVEVDRIKGKTVTLDTLTQTHGWNLDNYNFLNMDIQGAELMALRGAPKLLEKMDYLYLEVNTRELYEGCGLLPELDTFLDQHGFERKEIAMAYKNAVEHHGWGDAFYIRKFK